MRTTAAQQIWEAHFLRQERAARRRRVFRAVGVLALAALALTAAQRAAQGQETRTPCYSYTEVTEHLSKKYAEAPVAFGLQANGNLLQVYSCTKDCPGGETSWTLVSTTPKGMSCIVAAGKRWESLPPISHDPLA